MPLVSKKTALCALAIAGCVGLGFSGLTASASTDSAAPKHTRGLPGCVTVDNITERPMDYFTVGSKTPNNPLAKVGDGLSYHEHMFDLQDNVIGEAVGYGVATGINPVDGDLEVTYYHSGQLADGTFNVVAHTERHGLLTGKPYRIFVQGSSGKYAGKSGFGTWRLLDPPSATTRLGISMTMCG